MKRLMAFSLILTLTTLILIPVQAKNIGRYQIRVHPDDFKSTLHEFGSTRQLDVAGINIDNGTIDLIVTEDLYRSIADAYRTDVILTPEQMQALRVDPEYKTPDENRVILHQFAADYPDITDLISIGQTDEGRDIWAMKVSDNAAMDEDEPELLFNGQHHAREVMSCEIPLDIIEYLCLGYGSDPVVTAWVDSYQIWVIPQVNPDGINYVFQSYDMWRKDRTVNSGSGCIGVDPNRNYPAFWGTCNGSSGDPCDDTYRGSVPGESACVTHVMNMASGIKPVFDISYHSFSEIVIYPYSCQGDTTPEHALMANIGQSLGAGIERDNGTMGYNAGTSWQMLYPVDGGDVDWYYRDLGTFAYVVELNSDSQGFLPPYSWRDGTVERNRAGWQYLLQRMDGPAVSGRVLNACYPDQVIEGAEIQIQEYPLTATETPRTSDEFGSFFRLTGPGDYHMEISAPGYITGVFPVNVGTSRVDRDFHLVPEGSNGVMLLAVGILDGTGDDDGVMDPGETVQIPMSFVGIGDLTGVTATLTTGNAYANITDDSVDIGAIPDGGTGYTQPPHFVVDIDPGCPEQEVITFAITVMADQTLCTAAFEFSATVSSYTYVCPIASENLDADPGWEIDNSGSGGWEFGTPSGTPSGAYTGQYCYGTNLDGNHGNNGNYRLTSTPFDCSDIVNTELRFYRYLFNEAGYDTAYLKVSADGSTWDTVWSGYAADSGWTEVVYDISVYADGESEVRIQWQLTSDSYVTERGFYIDDVAICGETLPENHPTPEPTWTPVPTATPTGEATPTATPDPTFHSRLELNQTVFHPEDTFTLILHAGNGTPDTLNLDQYLILDVYNHYFFHPGWTPVPESVTRVFGPGDTAEDTILEFVWPDTGSSAAGLKFWLGYCDSGTSTLVGDVSWVEFGYSD